MSLDLIKYAYDPVERKIVEKTKKAFYQKIGLDPSYPRLLHTLNMLYDGLRKILSDDLRIILYFKTLALFQGDTKIYILIEDANYGSEMGVDAFGYLSSALNQKQYIKYLANELVSELAIARYIKSEKKED